MKNLVILLTSLLGVSSQGQENEMLISENPNAIYYLLTDTVKESSFSNENGNYLEYWVKAKTKGQEVVNGKKYLNNYDLIKFIVDCKSEKFKFLALITYNSKGEVLKSKYYSEIGKYNDIVPQSSSYTIVKAGCIYWNN